MTTNNGDLQTNRVAEGQEPLKKKFLLSAKKSDVAGRIRTANLKIEKSNLPVGSNALAHRATAASTTSSSRLHL